MYNLSSDEVLKIELHTKTEHVFNSIGVLIL